MSIDVSIEEGDSLSLNVLSELEKFSKSDSEIKFLGRGLPKNEICYVIGISSRNITKALKEISKSKFSNSKIKFSVISLSVLIYSPKKMLHIFLYHEPYFCMSFAEGKVARIILDTFKTQAARLNFKFKDLL